MSELANHKHQDFFVSKSLDSLIEPYEQFERNIYCMQIIGVSSVVQLYYLYLSDFLGTHIFELSWDNKILKHFYLKSLDLSSNTGDSIQFKINKRYLIMNIVNREILTQNNIERISGCYDLLNTNRHVLIDIVTCGTDGYISAKKEIQHEHDN